MKSNSKLRQIALATIMAAVAVMPFAPASKALAAESTNAHSLQVEASRGYWVNSGGGWWFAYYNGGYARNGIVTIDGNKYCFNNDGWMITGWYASGNNWYYFIPGWGGAATGWHLIGSCWYHFNSGGVMQTGWLNIDGTWYFLNDGGDMAVGWRWIWDSWYYFKSTGVMVTNEWVDGYYLRYDGKMIEGNGEGFDWLKGTWNGTLTRAAKNSAFASSDSVCYGAKNNPPTVVVKSVDTNLGYAILDITALVHEHYSLDNSASSAEGDVMRTRKDITISLKPGNTNWNLIYEYHRGNYNYTNDYDYYYLRINQDSTLELGVCSGMLHGNDINMSADIYTLNKV